MTINVDTPTAVKRVHKETGVEEWLSTGVMGWWWSPSWYMRVIDVGRWKMPASYREPEYRHFRVTVRRLPLLVWTVKMGDFVRVENGLHGTIEKLYISPSMPKASVRLQSGSLCEAFVDELRLPAKNARRQ